jgi:hypothetical protein
VFKAGETLRDSSELLSLDKISGGITAYKLRLTSYDEEFIKNAVSVLKEKNFNAVAFNDASIPADKIDDLVQIFLDNGLLPIAVNRMGMPRQVVEISAMNEKLYLCAKAVIGNGISASFDLADGIFGESTVAKCPNLNTRIELFKNITE